jgi:hypothetical protein
MSLILDGAQKKHPRLCHKALLLMHIFRRYFHNAPAEPPSQQLYVAELKCGHFLCQRRFAAPASCLARCKSMLGCVRLILGSFHEYQDIDQ